MKIIPITVLSLFIVFFAACTQSDDFAGDIQTVVTAETIDGVPEITPEDEDEEGDGTTESFATGNDTSAPPDNERD